MAIKLFGAVLVMLSCIIFGFYRSSIPLKRKKSLAIIDNGLEILENEIEFSCDYIDVILSRISQNTGKSALFEEFAASDKSIPVGIRWKNAVMKSKAPLCLSEADCEVLIFLSPELGITGRDAQLNSIRHARTLLKLRIRNSQTECQTTVKLYRGLGAAAGIFLAVLLF